MSEELQGLLNRIQEEGVKEADTKKDEILSNAKVEADKIIEDANAKAAEIIKIAKSDAQKSEWRAKSAIQQASRDIVLSLRQDLETRLQKVITNCVGDAMTPELMGDILLKMVEAYGKNSSDEGIEVILNKADYDKMEALFNGSLANDLKSNPDLSIGHDFKGGLKIGFKGDDVFFDCSDEAISDIICNFVGPKLAETLKS